MIGRFPDYRRVLPRNATKIVEGSWEILKQAFVRASILSNERVRSVRLNLSENQLKLPPPTQNMKKQKKLLMSITMAKN